MDLEELCEMRARMEMLAEKINNPSEHQLLVKVAGFLGDLYEALGGTEKPSQPLDFEEITDSSPLPPQYGP